MNNCLAIFLGGCVLALSSPGLAVAGDVAGEFGGKDAADGLFGKAGDLSGTSEDRAQRIHEQQTDDKINRANNNSDGQGLTEEKQYRREHQN